MDREVGKPRVLVVAKVRAGSIYKLLLLGLLVSMLFLGVIFGVAAFFGADTVMWNHQPVHGWAALLLSPLVTLVAALFFALFIGTLVVVGLWFYSLFSPIELRMVLHEEETDDRSP